MTGIRILVYSWSSSGRVFNKAVLEWLKIAKNIIRTGRSHRIGAVVLMIAFGILMCAPLSESNAAAGDASGERPGQQALSREIDAEGYRIQLDLSSQVLRLSAPVEKIFGMSPESKENNEDLLQATLAGLTEDGFVSSSALAQKAKQFDDGLYAAIELAAQGGSGKFAGKISLLKQLTAALAEQNASGQVPAIIFAAAGLGGVAVETPRRLVPLVRDETDKFLADPLRSKPIAFYGWTNELTQIFRQDRMLQTGLDDPAGVKNIVTALHTNKGARTVYEKYLALVSGLTNPPAKPDLRASIAALDQGKSMAPEEGVCFFPPSRSHETELIKKLYGNTPIPTGFTLVDEMIKRIRSGKLSLNPSNDSGWYDYQVWALETMVTPEKMPEAGHLNYSEDYRGQLLELFQGILAMTRETHIKQLEIPRAGMAMPGPQVIIKISPELSVEPLATFYLRRATGYRFVRNLLENIFAAEALGEMHRLTIGGAVEKDLSQELKQMETLFCGAYLTACREIGLKPADLTGLGFKDLPSDPADPFRMWRGDLEKDPDLAQDARMMVPVFYDTARRKTKVWMMLGWAKRPLVVDFVSNPKAVVFNKEGSKITNDGPQLKFVSARYSLAYPVSAEVYVDKILDRSEFRTLCDQYNTRSAIMERLK